MPELPKRKLSAEPVLTTLPADTRLPALLTPQSQPDKALRNPTAGAAAVAAWLAPFAGGNAAKFPLKVVRTLADRAALSLDSLCLETTCIIVDPASGAPKSYVLKYTPFQAGVTLRVHRDGNFNSVLSDAQWYASDAPEAGVPNWAQLQTNPPAADYAFADGELVRWAVAPSTTEFFFSAIGAGTWAAPTAETGDAHWMPVARQNVPTPARTAWEAIVGDPLDNDKLATLLATLPSTAYVDSKVQNSLTPTSATKAPSVAVAVAAFALKANFYSVADYLNEQVFDVDPATGDPTITGVAFGQAAVLKTAAQPFALPGGTLPGSIGRVVALRATVNIPAGQITIPPNQNGTTPGQIEGATSFGLQANEYVWLRRTATGYDVVLDGRNILTSPNGSRWRLSVNNAGALTTTAL